MTEQLERGGGEGRLYNVSLLCDIAVLLIHFTFLERWYCFYGRWAEGVDAIHTKVERANEYLRKVLQVVRLEVLYVSLLRGEQNVVCFE